MGVSETYINEFPEFVKTHLDLNLDEKTRNKFNRFLREESPIGDKHIFYQEFPGNKFSTKINTSMYCDLSLVGLFNNKDKKFTLSSQNKLVDSILENEDLVNTLRYSKKHSYSVLAYFERYGYGNSKYKLYVRTQPVLFVPEVDNETKLLIEKWEDSHVGYFKEDNIFSTRKKISSEEYFY